MKDKTKQAKNKEYQDKRKAELQAAAERDGFENWSEALTAWKNGQARLIHTPPSHNLRENYETLKSITR